MNDSNGSVVRAIRGPITLITVGALFALNNFTRYTFDQTWPVLLIVFGLLTLLRRGVDSPRHAPPPGAPPYAPPPYSYNDPAAGGYRDSRYRQPAPENAGTVKGGFGASAPPRPTTDPGGNPPAGGPA